MAIKFNEKKEIKLHIGGGNEYLNDWINVDNNPYNMISKLDLNLDIYKPLPFKDNSVNMIYDKSFLKKIETLSDADIEAFLWNFRCMLKPAGVLKIEITYPYMKNQLEPWLNKLGFPNVEFNCTGQEINPLTIMNNTKQAITDDIVIIDSLFPQKEPDGDRNIQVNAFLNSMDNLNTYTMYTMYPDKDACFTAPYGISIDNFNENKEEYLKVYPQNERKLNHISPTFKYNFKLACSNLLGETYTLLPFYERNEIPFVFILHPDDIFVLNNESSDIMLKKIFESKYFKKVIILQKDIKDYLVDKRLCPPTKIEFLSKNNNNIKEILTLARDEKLISKPNASYVTLGKTMKLNIGCGSKYTDGWINIDNDPENKNKLDLNWNLNDSLPYQDALVDFIYCTSQWQDLNTNEGINSLNDLYRILKPDGALRLAVNDFKNNNDLKKLEKKIKNIGFSFVKKYDAKISNYFEFIDIETDNSTSLFIEAIK